MNTTPINDEQLQKLADLDIHLWIKYYGIKTETGIPLDFHDHRYMLDIYSDFSPNLVLKKAAQITATTCEILKSLFGIHRFKLDAIYTLPTESDVGSMVGAKVNRLIANNPILQKWTKDKDTIFQKQVGNNFIHYKGTWTEKAAIMVPSDWNLYDEVDASNQNVIEQYATRQQHSRFRWEHYFSHPSTDGYGVDKIWEISDQKHWFITCGVCGYEQYMDWPESVDIDRGIFVCKDKNCRAEITNDIRRNGRWVPKFKNKKFSGYWIPLLICPWVSAKDIIDYFNTKSEEYFYNKVLGKSYIGGGNKLTKALLMRNLTEAVITPEKNDRVVIGIDTGKHIHIVCGTEKGIFYYSYSSNYDEVDELMKRWPRAIIVVDQGGDLIGSRELREKYLGRVFLCSYGEDRKTKELVRWGSKDEDGAVIADRNRMIQLVVSEFSDKRIPLQGTENDWYDYWLHWNALTRITEETDRKQVRRVWVRNGADHWAHATVYLRVGLSRFAGKGGIIQPERQAMRVPEGPTIAPDGTIPAPDPKKIFQFEDPKDTNDWRT